MVDVAQGQFILLLNNDVQLRQDALKTLMEATKTHGDGIFGIPYSAQINYPLSAQLNYPAVIHYSPVA